MSNGWPWRNKRNYTPWGLILGPLPMVCGLLMYLLWYDWRFLGLLLLLGGLALTLYGLLARLCGGGGRLAAVAFAVRRLMQAAFFFCVLLTAVIQCLIFSEIKGDVDAAADIVLVLGAGLDGDKPSWVLANRLDAAIAYMNRYPDLDCVVSGGQGPNELVPEAQAMYDYMVERGIDAQRITRESQSRNTEENILFSLPLIGPERTKVAVVTSGFHLYRAKLLCRQAGLEPVGVSAATPLPHLNVWLHIRETASVIFAWLGL